MPNLNLIQLKISSAKAKLFFSANDEAKMEMEFEMRTCKRKIKEN